MTAFLYQRSLIIPLSLSSLRGARPRPSQLHAPVRPKPAEDKDVAGYDDWDQERDQKAERKPQHRPHGKRVSDSVTRGAGDDEEDIEKSKPVPQREPAAACPNLLPEDQEQCSDGSNDNVAPSGGRGETARQFSPSAQEQKVRAHESGGVNRDQRPQINRLEPLPEPAAETPSGQQPHRQRPQNELRS